MTNSERFKLGLTLNHGQSVGQCEVVVHWVNYPDGHPHYAVHQAKSTEPDEIRLKATFCVLDLFASAYGDNGALVIDDPEPVHRWHAVYLTCQRYIERELRRLIDEALREHHEVTP